MADIRESYVTVGAALQLEGAVMLLEGAVMLLEGAVHDPATACSI